MPPTRFALSFSPGLRWMFIGLGMGPRQAGIEIGDTTVEVRMGWSFRARIARSSIVGVEPYDGRVYAWGAHGWRHRWLVNGSSRGIAVITMDPMQPGRVLGFPIKLRELALSLENRDAFLAALR
jgi:hypothetical protein